MQTTQVQVESPRAEPTSEQMRAVVYDAYGPFDALAVRTIDRPSVGETQVLVRVCAASLHIGDCFAIHGKPYGMRLMTGLSRPKQGIPGFDLAGVVEAVGKAVQRFKPGDEVFGASWGTCAEYVRAEADHLARKPEKLDFGPAAALVTSGLAALHAMRDVAKLKAGQKILIIGASGGVGHLAVQLAKEYGAEVTGVCSSHSGAMVRFIGADHIVDYAHEDFAQSAARYDVVFDNIEDRSLGDCRRVLTPDGMLILNSGRGADGIPMLIRLLKPLVVSRFVRHNLRRYLSTPSHADLKVLAELAEAEKLIPVIHATYPLEETAHALRQIEAGHVRGKVVVHV
ncbi:MAG TPA: NAD(P)-dependent alcohol dehydrogenase [Polyangiales bacterium]|nr:NAD(P)-dependent alcohol dehydrogenase [Polyangiales bacterium]